MKFKDPSGFGPGDVSRMQPAWTNEYSGGLLGAGGGAVGAGLGQIISKVIGLVADVIILNAISEEVGKSYEKGKEEKSKEKKEEQEKKDAPEERNWKQDKKLSEGEIRKLKDNGYNVHELKSQGAGEASPSRYDLYKDKSGNLYVKPKSGKGAGEAVDVNINKLD